MSKVPNLDAMPEGELMQFWGRHQRGWGFRSLFPAGGPGAKKATNNLAAYASNKATAMRLRLKGDIQEALKYEGICERIYEQLPREARW